MVNVIWVSLPAQWSLYSVQAGLQVVIAVLCFVGIFVFARTCWQASSVHITRNRPISLPSLISIHTLSEAYDVLFLLRLKIFHPRHWKILSQCIVVLLLSVATIVSGPIAKASTRIGIVVRPVLEDGLLANRGFNSLGYGYVQWNETMSKLDKAGFPYDQLLDFIPDSEFDWVYREGEWNSTWSMSCNKTESTPITLTDTGNCVNVYTEIPDIQDFFPRQNFKSIYTDYFGLYEGIAHIKDSLLILTGWTPSLETGNLFPVSNMTFSVAALLNSDVGQNLNKSNNCVYAQGPIGSSSYTMVQCAIQKVVNQNNYSLDAAYPDHRDLSVVPSSYISHFTPRLSRESASGEPITPLSPEELIRFYQAYLVTKDTFKQHPITRMISQKIPLPQVSATFLALASLLLVLDLAGLINILWFTYKHFHVILHTPESKLDWAIQSIGETSDATNVGPGGINQGLLKQYSVVATTPVELAGAVGTGTGVRSGDQSLTMRKASRLRAFFESARFASDHHHQILGLHSIHHGEGGDRGFQDSHGNDESIPLKQYPGHMGIVGTDTIGIAPAGSGLYSDTGTQKEQWRHRSQDGSVPASASAATSPALFRQEQQATFPYSPPEPTYFHMSALEAQFASHNDEINNSDDHRHLFRGGFQTPSSPPSTAYYGYQNNTSFPNPDYDIHSDTSYRGGGGGGGGSNGGGGLTVSSSSSSPWTITHLGTNNGSTATGGRRGYTRLGGGRSEA